MRARKLLLENRFHSLHLDGDIRGMKQGVVDQTMMDRLCNSLQVQRGKFTGNLERDAKFIQARWIFGLVGSDGDDRAFLRQVIFPQVLCGIKTGARTKRGEKQLWRSHDFVETAIFSRLVARNGVLTSFNFKL